MPRSRRRHHSRSRSRSNSHDRDREPKRRKVESFDSLHNRRSVSSEPEANENSENALNDCPNENIIQHSNNEGSDSLLVGDSCPQPMESKNSNNPDATPTDVTDNFDYKNIAQKQESKEQKPENNEALADRVENENNIKQDDNCLPTEISQDMEQGPDKDEQELNENKVMDAMDESILDDTLNTDLDTTNVSLSSGPESSSENNARNPCLQKESSILKPLTPKQLKRKQEFEERRKARAIEKEMRRKQIQEEREVLRNKRKQEKEAKAREEREAKEKERELKRKEKEEKEEQKRKEKEEKEEIKRKEREKEEAKRKAERLKKQAEIDEKNREKQKIEEQKQKAAAAFTKFFVAKTNTAELKKEDASDEQSLPPIFMPFQVKSDMRLAPTTRNVLTSEAKLHLVDCLNKQDMEHRKYLHEIKELPIRTSPKTWVIKSNDDDDVVKVEENFGDSIIKPTNIVATKMKTKFFKFDENRRPPYYGTWRKKSKKIKGRRPLVQDDILNYEIDSDDEWEEEEEGEDIPGSDDDEKEPDGETDYEVDNDFFVPHGHLSDDEQNDDEEDISPELRKAKEKLLKNQFDEERKSQTQKLKPRVIGCIWYNNNEEDYGVDEAIHKFLKPFSIISNGVVAVKSRAHIEIASKYRDELSKDLMPDFLRLLHGNLHKKRAIATEFIEYLAQKNVDAVVSKASLARLIQRIAQWKKCLEDGPMFKKFCWQVSNEIRVEFKHVDLVLPNQWKYCTDPKLSK